MKEKKKYPCVKNTKKFRPLPVSVKEKKRIKEIQPSMILCVFYSFFFLKITQVSVLLSKKSTQFLGPENVNFFGRLVIFFLRF